MLFLKFTCFFREDFAAALRPNKVEFKSANRVRLVAQLNEQALSQMHKEYDYKNCVEGKPEVETLWGQDLQDRIQANIWKIDQFMEPKAYEESLKKSEEEKKRIIRVTQAERDLQACKERVLKSAHDMKLKIWDPKDKDWGDKPPKARQQPSTQQEEDDLSRMEQFLASQEGQTWAATHKWTNPDQTKLLEEKAATWEAKWVAENTFAEKVTSVNQQLIAAGGTMIAWMKGKGLTVEPQ